MERREPANLEYLTRFLKSYMKENAPYRAGTMYQDYIRSCTEAGLPDQTISQKDFAMLLRAQVEKEDGLLKRTAYGVYEIRTDPADRGLVYPRKTRMDANPLEIDARYFQGIPVTQEDAQLDKIYDDATKLMARMQAAFFTLQQYAEIYPEMKLEVSSFHAATLKRMDDVASDISAVMAWCEDHSEELDIAQEVKKYLKSDDFQRDFTEAMLTTTDSVDRIRNRLIQEQRGQLEQTAICNAEGHACENTADPENGISEMDCEHCGESMTLSW